MRKKRIAGPLLALLAALCLPLSAPALAAERPSPPGEAEEEQAFVWSPLETEADNGELFAAYVRERFYGGASLADPAGDRLEGLDQKLYDALKRAVKETAERGGSAVYEISCGELGLRSSWTSEDLDGLPVPDGDGAIPGLHVRAALSALLADLSNELYWFDRTAESPVTYALPELLAVPGTEEEPPALRLEGGFRFAFAVAPDFQDGGGSEVTADVAAVGAAVRNGRAILAAHRDEDGAQKLLSFLEELRTLAGPGRGAEGGGAFGDPWQLIRALDGDPDTPAAAEGWSLAFQYLCGLSGLREMECRAVSGLTQENEDAPRPHMWNVVQTGGKYYLADVAASLDGGPGRDGGLFLAGASVYRETDPAGWEVRLPSGTVRYWFEGEDLPLAEEGL